MAAVMTLALRPGTVVGDSPRWTLAINLNQNLIGRLVIVLRRDEQSVTGLTAGEWADLHREIARTRAALDALFRPDQYNYAFLMNQDADVHLHVVPRYAAPRDWAGERFEDAHYGELFGHEQRLLDTDLLTRLAGEIRGRLPPWT